MHTLSKNQVILYETLEDVRVSDPYAIEDADELSRVISRFVAWAQMMGMYPDLAARYGTAHIRLATDLRAAVKASRENRLYPNMILPMTKCFSAKLLWATTQAVMMEPAFTEMMERETRR